MDTTGRDPSSGDASHNPFQAPRSRVADPAPENSGVLLDEPCRNDAGRGWTWFKDGWGLFKEAPGTWIGILLSWMVVAIVLSLIPLVSLLLNLVSPVIIGGMMLGCRSLEQGQGLSFSHLFAGFQRHAAKLMLVGLLYLLGVAVIGFSVFVVMLGSSGALGVFAGTPAEAEDVMMMLLAFLVMAALLVPMMMAWWFAPALVVFHDMGTLQAMGLSFRGCLRNIMPFLVYGIVGLVAAILATLPVGLGWLVLGPVFVCSMYKAYKDIFVA
jgi:uncharacterized membrane protein